jgi:hypothetical protein
MQLQDLVNRRADSGEQNERDAYGESSHGKGLMLPVGDLSFGIGSSERPKQDAKRHPKCAS